MDTPITLYSWSAKRAGDAISITHSCGKITRIVSIEPEMIDDGSGVASIIATHHDGRRFRLAVAAGRA